RECANPTVAHAPHSRRRMPVILGVRQPHGGACATLPPAHARHLGSAPTPQWRMRHTPAGACPSSRECANTTVARVPRKLVRRQSRSDCKLTFATPDFSGFLRLDE